MGVLAQEDELTRFGGREVLGQPGFGKLVGIILAAMVLFALLGTYFEGVLLFKHWWDKMDPVPTPVWVTAVLERWALPGEATDLLRGVGLWANLTLDTAPGLILSFSQVMVLVAVAVSLATRVPTVVNLVAVLVAIGHQPRVDGLADVGLRGLALRHPPARPRLLPHRPGPAGRHARRPRRVRPLPWLGLPVRPTLHPQPDMQLSLHPAGQRCPGG